MGIWAQINLSVFAESKTRVLKRQQQDTLIILRAMGTPAGLRFCKEKPAIQCFYSIWSPGAC